MTVTSTRISRMSVESVNENDAAYNSGGSGGFRSKMSVYSVPPARTTIACTPIAASSGSNRLDQMWRAARERVTPGSSSRRTS